MKCLVKYQIEIEEVVEITTSLDLEVGDILDEYRVDFNELVNSEEIENIEIPTNKYVENTFEVKSIEIL